jgi:hypothetical protein
MLWLGGHLFSAPARNRLPVALTAKPPIWGDMALRRIVSANIGCITHLQWRTPRRCGTG